MTTWNYRIETTADFERAVKFTQTTESVLLEFKTDVPRRKAQEAVQRRAGRLEFARDLAQFANTDGGCILLGIAETERAGKRIAERVEPVEDFEAVRAAIEQSIQEFLVPTTISPRIVPIQVPDGLIVAVNVLPSASLVWVWDRQKHTMECLRRSNLGKEWLNPDEVERHLMNGSRASRLRLAEAASRCRLNSNDLVRVRLSCGVWSVVQGREPEFLEQPNVSLGTLEPDEFAIRIDLSEIGKSPTLTLPYEVVRAAWKTSDGYLGLVVDLSIVTRTTQFRNPLGQPELRTVVTIESFTPVARS